MYLVEVVFCFCPFTFQSYFFVPHLLVFSDVYLNGGNQSKSFDFVLLSRMAVSLYSFFEVLFNEIKVL